jgi:hypothetical protein
VIRADSDAKDSKMMKGIAAAARVARKYVDSGAADHSGAVLSRWFKVSIGINAATLQRLMALPHFSIELHRVSQVGFKMFDRLRFVALVQRLEYFPMLLKRSHRTAVPEPDRGD